LTRIVERARAKLNLALHVRARRADGYHELETLFAFVEHGDEIIAARAEAPSFTLTGRFKPELAGEGDNLVMRAAAAFQAEFGGGPWAIQLGKWLPVASGLGGGSADAAATMRALAALEGVDPLDPRLFAIAERLGSDVPACLLGRTAVGRGRGEALESIPGRPGTPVLLVNPGVAVSTAEVFRAWDGVDLGPLEQGTLLDIAMTGRNDLEDPAMRVAPVICEVLTELGRTPAALVRMSGSGATCFGLYLDEARRDAASQAIRKSHPHWWRCETALTD
jgi:4-diphosphocytidyl-2-C-methyl-D-erythritol kinase